MKASLKALRPATQTLAGTAPEDEASPAYRTAATRAATRQVSGHFPADEVKAFRVLAADQDRDVQELLAEGINMIFERYGRPERIEITSGRRKRV